MAALYRIGVDLSGSNVFGGGRATHYFLAAGGTASQAATAVATFWGAVDAYMSSLTRWDLDTEVQTVESTTGLITGATFISAAGAAGTDSSAAGPPATQGLVQWRTPTVAAGRILRGRTYIPGVPQGMMTSAGAPHATYQNALDAAGEALMNDAVSTLVVYSNTHKVYGTVDNVTVWNKFAELRSRRD